MAEYIEREAAIAAIRGLYPGIPLVKVNLEKWHEKNRNFMACETAIERIPAADVRPVVRGRWEPVVDANEDGSPYQAGIHCSECGHFDVWEFNFCPNCGADMRGKS